MSDPLRILHVLDHSFPHRSGYAMRSRSIIRFQKHLGLDPLVLTSPRHGASTADAELIDGVMHHRIGRGAGTIERVFRSVPIQAERSQIRRVARRIIALSRELRPDIVHAHSPSLNGLAALEARRTTGIPVVYELRAFWEDAAVDQAKFREGSWKYRLSQAAETWLVRRVDHVVAICEGIRHELIRRGINEQNISLAPNGVDLDAFSNPDSDAVRSRLGLQDCSVLGFIGSFFRYEGLQLLVDAMGILKGSHPRLRALLVGAGEMDDELRRQVRANGLDGRVLFTGSVPHEQVRDYYAAMDVMVYPRLSRRITEYTTPLKPLEAMAQRKLVIGSNVGGIAELVQDGRTGFLFPADSCEALAATIAQAIADPNGHSGIRDAGARYVQEERQWETIVGRYACIYEAAMARRRALSAIAAPTLKGDV